MFSQTNFEKMLVHREHIQKIPMFRYIVDQEHIRFQAFNIYDEYKLSFLNFCLPLKILLIIFLRNIKKFSWKYENRGKMIYWHVRNRSLTISVFIFCFQVHGCHRKFTNFYFKKILLLFLLLEFVLIKYILQCTNLYVTR